MTRYSALCCTNQHQTELKQNLPPSETETSNEPAILFKFQSVLSEFMFNQNRLSNLHFSKLDDLKLMDYSTCK